MTLPTKALTGSRAKLWYNNVAIGYCTNITAEETYDYEPVEVLDVLEVPEYCITAYRVTWSCSMLMLAMETIRTKGLAKEPKDLLTDGGLNAVVKTRDTNVNSGINRITLRKSKCTTRSITIPARGLITQDLNFNAVLLEESAASGNSYESPVTVGTTANPY